MTEKIVITESDIDRVEFSGDFFARYILPAKKKSNFNTTSQTRAGLHEYNQVWDLTGCNLRALLHHAVVDVKSNVSNNVRPKYPTPTSAGDGDAVCAAKEAKLAEWTEAGEVVLRFADRARNLLGDMSSAQMASKIANNAPAIIDNMSQEQIATLLAALQAKAAPAPTLALETAELDEDELETEDL